jgi:hypothetical protein
VRQSHLSQQVTGGARQPPYVIGGCRSAPLTCLNDNLETSRKSVPPRNHCFDWVSKGREQSEIVSRPLRFSWNERNREKADIKRGMRSLRRFAADSHIQRPDSRSERLAGNATKPHKITQDAI